MTEFPLVTIIILNWNQADMTLDCLQSLKHSTYPNYQIVIVDNGSKDQSVEKIHAVYPTVSIIENKENVGYSEGNNIGIRYALQSSTQYIFLLNNDTLIDPRMLTQLVEVAESDPHIGICGPTMYYADPAEMLWAGENHIDLKHMRILKKGMGEIIQQENLTRKQPVDVEYIDSCAILIKRSVLGKIGLMDSKYFIFFDDTDLNIRALKVGYRIVYVPQAIIWHKVSASMGITSPATTYYFTRNSLLFYTRYTNGLRKWIVFINYLFSMLWTISAWSIKREYKTSLYHKKRLATWMAFRDYFMGRFGKMGSDVSKICYE